MNQKINSKLISLLEHFKNFFLKNYKDLNKKSLILLEGIRRDYLKELTFRTWLIEKVDEYIDKLVKEFERFFLPKDITIFNFENFLYEDADWIKVGKKGGAVIGYKLDFSFPDWKKVFQEVLKELGYEKYSKDKDLLYRLEEEIIEDDEFFASLYYFAQDFFIKLFEEYFEIENYMYLNLFYDRYTGIPFVGVFSKKPSEFFTLDEDCLKRKLISFTKEIKENDNLWYKFIKTVIHKDNYDLSLKTWIKVFEGDIYRFCYFLVDNNFDYLDCVFYTEEFLDFLKNLKKTVKKFKNTIESEDFWIKEFVSNWENEIKKEIRFYEIDKGIKEKK